MKKNYYQIIFAILFLMGLLFNSALADDKIKIQLKQPPPNLMGVKDLWKMDITNTTRENINIYLTGTAAESKKGLIVSGKSKVLTISPGTKSYDYNDFKNGGEVNWKDKSIQEVLLRTGNVPEGEYTICVTAFYENNEIADQENCIEQSIKMEGSITLISPDDGAEIDSKQPVLFSWTPLVPKPNGGVTYRLKVWQLMQGQNSTTAMRTNQPIVTKDVDNITQIMVADLNAAGPCPPFICQFTWNVQAMIQGQVVENYNSDPSAFSIKTSISNSSDVIYQSAFLDPGPPEKMKCNARGTDCITTSVLILPQKTTLNHDANLQAATIKINAILDGIRSSGKQSGKRPCLYDSKYGYLLIWVSDTPPEKPTNMLITDPDKIAEFLKIKEDKPFKNKLEISKNSDGDRIYNCTEPGNTCSGASLVDAENTPIHDEELIQATQKINAILSEYAAKTPRPDTKLCILKIPAGIVLAWVSTSGSGEGERITITPDSKQYEDIINESLGIKGNNNDGEKPPPLQIRFYFKINYGVWKDSTCVSGWGICGITIGFKDDKLIANMGTGTLDGDMMTLQFTDPPKEMGSEFEIGKDILVEGYTDSSGRQIYIKKGVYKVDVIPGLQPIKIVSFTVKNKK